MLEVSLVVERLIIFNLRVDGAGGGGEQGVDLLHVDGVGCDGGARCLFISDMLHVRDSRGYGWQQSTGATVNTFGFAA